MKKIVIILSGMFLLLNLNGQIIYDHTGYQNNYLVKLGIAGYKYVSWSTVPTINIYNLNHTLYKSISIPSSYTVGPSLTYFYVSDNLFDLDNGVEYMVYKYSSSSTYSSNISILDESGAVLFSKDSAAITGQTGGPGYKTSFYNQDIVYYDGVNVKMKLDIFTHSPMFSSGYTRSLYYNLPGPLPCVGCTSGITSLISGTQEEPKQEVEFYPNPTSDQLKLKYKLPEGSHLAEMKIYDTQGKLVDEFKVTDTFDFIYLPTNYNNGLYLYSLIVDGKTIKTEKIVLNK